MRRLLMITASLMLWAALSASGALADSTTTINFGNAPEGAHFVTGTPTPTCTVSGLTVSCNSYEIAGVGHTNAVANLSATYSAIVDCFNPGVNPNNPIESHTTTFSLSATSGQISPKNGRLTVPSLSVSPTAPDLAAAALCPNPNWTAVIRPGTLQLVSFTYTVTFEGFSAPVITITGNDP
jgi:hypothetical protein